MVFGLEEIDKVKLYHDMNSLFNILFHTISFLKCSIHSVDREGLIVNC